MRRSGDRCADTTLLVVAASDANPIAIMTAVVLNMMIERRAQVVRANATGSAAKEACLDSRRKGVGGSRDDEDLEVVMADDCRRLEGPHQSQDFVTALAGFGRPLAAALVLLLLCCWFWLVWG